MADVLGAGVSGAVVRDFERLVYAGVPDMITAFPDHGAMSSEDYFGRLLQALPAAIYATDADGRIVFYNEAAATLWGCRPTLGASEFCGSWKLYWPDGTPLPHDECPMALTLKMKQPVRGMEAIAERPDGTRVPFIPYPTPLFDATGTLIGAVNMLLDITDRQQADERLRDSEARYRSIFDNASVAVWEEDFSAVVDMLADLRAQGISDLHGFFQARPDRLAEAIGRVRVVDVNDFTVELFESDSKPALLQSLGDIFLPETELIFIDELIALWEGRRRFAGETVLRTLKGKRLDVIFTMTFDGARAERTLVSILDISARKAAEQAVLAQTYRLEKLNRIARAITGDLQLDHIVQTVTDAATELSGARFGAFLYNVADDQGGHYQLFALSGAPRTAFEKLGLPRTTAVFASTFRGTGIVRSDDIRRDPRYGKNAPHHGIPLGHLPVASYLAVPVVSRSGEVHGGLFFGHDRPGIFTRDSEDIVAAIAAHAAIALDNARLLQSAEATSRRRADDAAQRLAAIVEYSDDAIVSKNLDGTITSWNRGAQRLFGYTPEEIIGKPIMMLIPPDRRDEELTILDRIRRGEHIDHFATVRHCKDGSLVEVSITVSPVKDADGRIVGASKIARDITERRRAEEQQELLVREMSHRIKNLFAVTNSVIALSARTARSPQDMAAAVQGRLSALTRAHDLTRPGVVAAQQKFGQHTSLQAIIRTILSPYVEAARSVRRDRIVISGPDVPVGPTAITSLALIFHEFATNAAKYGALSTPTGRVAIDCAVNGDDMVMTWQERGGPLVNGTPESEGFGGQLARRMVAGQFDGDASWDWQPDGVVIRLSMPMPRLAM